MKKKSELKPKLASKKEIESLKKLSIQRLVIWIVGKSQEMNMKLTPEEIVLECWLINPEKFSMRGYNQFPDSAIIQKRIGDMKGKKGILIGSETNGYSLTEISKPIYFELKNLIKLNKIQDIQQKEIPDRSLSLMEEAPYKRLTKTPAYIKFKDNRIDEIVETDFLYFYGINWHSKKSFVENRIINADAVVKVFGKKDKILREVHLLLNEKFGGVKTHLLNK